MEEKEKKEVKLLWLSPMAAALVLILAFKAAHRFPGDGHIFMEGDYYVQFMNYIVMFWRKLLGGNGILYSFDVGLGASTLEHYAFYGFSPFNAVFVLINDTDTAAFALFALKSSAAAFFMHLFLRNSLKVNEKTAFIFSFSYALCAYVINFNFGIILLDYVYILPLVMMMLYRAFETGHMGGLGAAYAYSFITAYYGGYMIGIFSFVCFICMLAGEKDKERIKKLVPGYVFAVGTAVLISAVVTLPTAVSILAGHGGDPGTKVTLSLFIWDIIGDLYPMRKLEATSVLPSVYTGLPAVIFALAFFMNRERSRKEKLIAAVPFIFLIVCMLFKPAYLMMHGFDAPDGYHFRFAFLFSFYLVLIAAKGAKDSGMKAKQAVFLIVAVAYPAAMALGMLTLPAESVGLDSLRIGIVVFFVMLYYLALRGENKYRDVIICVLVFAELFMNSYFAITPDKQTPIRYKDTYNLWQAQGEKAVSAINANEQDELFYRLNYRDGMYTNDSMYFGFHGLSYFSSMEQTETREALKDLGYSTGSRVVIERGGSPFTEMILSQKYRVYTSPDMSLEEPEKVIINENTAWLPLGFMTSEKLLDPGEMTDDAFENQQTILDAMIGYHEPIWEEYTGGLEVECENAELVPADGKISMIRQEPGDAQITLTIPAREGKDSYAYISYDKSKMIWSSPRMASDAQGLNVGLVVPVFTQMESLIPMGEDEGKSNVYIFFKDNTVDESVADRFYFAYFDNDALERAYEALKPGGLKIVSMTDQRIKGVINAPEDKSLMFTSIPYDKGWHIKVDGAETESLAVMDGAFLAAKIGEGEHEIEIYYDNIYIKAGLIISILGLIMLVIQILGEKQIFCKKSQKNFT